MLAAAAVVPSSPLLLRGAAALDAHTGDATAVCRTLRDCDAVLLVAPATPPTAPGGPGRPAGRNGAAGRSHLLVPVPADLASLGRPDLTTPVVCDEQLRRCLVDAGLTGREGRSLSHAVLALLLAQGDVRLPVVAVVLEERTGDDLRRLGERLAEVLAADDRPLGLLAAGDLSAGHGDCAPLTALPAAATVDRTLVDAVRAGDVAAAAAPGLDLATSVGALGWASCVVWLATLEASSWRPRGVKYRVSHGVGRIVADAESVPR